MSVLDRFRAALPSERQSDVDPDLGTLLVELAAGGRSSWPTVIVTDDDFAAYLGARMPVSGDLRTALLAAPIADLYLACGCALGLPAAQTAFDTLLGEVDEAAVAVRAARDVADEVKQLLRAQLLIPQGDRPPGIAGYGGRGGLRGWLRITATRELVRHVKRQLRDRPLDEAVLEDGGTGDPVLERMKAQYRGELKEAIREAIAGMEPHDRTLLRHQLIDGLGIDQIGPLYGVHRATAARWLARVRAALAAGTQQALARRLRLAPDEVSSIIRLVQSRFDLSIDTVLGADPDQR